MSFHSEVGSTFPRIIIECREVALRILLTGSEQLDITIFGGISILGCRGIRY